MDKLNSKHFVFFILATTIVSLKTYPGIFMKDGGRESWIAISISSALIYAFYIYNKHLQEDRSL